MVTLDQSIRLLKYSLANQLPEYVIDMKNTEEGLLTTAKNIKTGKEVSAHIYGEDKFLMTDFIDKVRNSDV